MNRTHFRDPLFRGILGVAAFFAALHIGWILLGGQQRTLTPEAFTFIITVTSTATIITLLLGVFLALGRYRVLLDHASLWIAAALASFSIGVVFRVLTFPFLPGATSLVGQSPNTTAWTGILASTIFGCCLLNAVRDRSPADEASLGTRRQWLAASWPVSVAVLCTVFVMFGEYLPVVVRANGSFTYNPLVVVCLCLNLAILAVGTVLATRRYLRDRDLLPAFVAFAQVALLFGQAGIVAGGNRYSLMAAADRFIMLSGYLLMLFGLLSDYVRLLTRERQKTRDLQARSAELTGILRDIPEAVFVTDPRAGVRFASRSALDMLGVQSLEEIRQTLGEQADQYLVNDRDDRPIPPEERPFARVARGEVFSVEEVHFLNPKQGTPCWLLVSGRPLMGETGTQFGGLLVATDITERKRSETRILELNRELALHVAQLETLLQEKLLLLREVQHRVKNNLQVISSLASMQARKVGDGATRQAFTALRDRVKSMALIHEGLCFSDMLAEIDFAKFVQDLGRTLIQSYAPNPDSIRLHVDIDAILRLDEATPCGLIVNELLSNALKHAFPGSRRGDIWIGLHQEDGFLSMKFRDNGIGMPSGFSVEMTDSLGLLVVTDLAAQLGGKFTWANDGGCVFLLRFPRRQPIQAMARQTTLPEQRRTD